MIKTNGLLAALLFAFASVAHAEPATSQGAASVQKNLDANKSGGKADKGLTTAETNITKPHTKKAKASKKTKVDKASKADKPDHPSKPDRPGK